MQISKKLPLNLKSSIEIFAAKLDLVLNHQIGQPCSYVTILLRVWEQIYSTETEPKSGIQKEVLVIDTTFFCAHANMDGLILRDCCIFYLDLDVVAFLFSNFTHMHIYTFSSVAVTPPFLHWNFNFI